MGVIPVAPPPAGPAATTPPQTPPADPAPAAATNTPQAQPPAAPETFSREYVEQLRQEAAGHRTRAKTAEDALAAQKTAEAGKVKSAEERLAALEQANVAATERALRLEAIAKHGLTVEDLDFLPGTTAESIEQQAAKLAGRLGKAPVVAGTITNPPANQAPGIDERITAAEKSGDALTSIRLKRERAFGAA